MLRDVADVAVARLGVLVLDLDGVARVGAAVLGVRRRLDDRDERRDAALRPVDRDPAEAVVAGGRNGDVAEIAVEDGTGALVESDLVKAAVDAVEREVVVCVVGHGRVEVGDRGVSECGEPERVRECASSLEAAPEVAGKPGKGVTPRIVRPEAVCKPIRASGCGVAETRAGGVVAGVRRLLVCVHGHVGLVGIARKRDVASFTAIVPVSVPELSFCTGQPVPVSLQLGHTPSTATDCSSTRGDRARQLSVRQWTTHLDSRVVSAVTFAGPCIHVQLPPRF